MLRRNELEAARRAGADFAVAPLLDASLVATAVEEGMPFIPGAFTPTEIATAWAAGATFVKLFPAASVGPAFVRGLRGSMPDAQLIPTGGIDAASAAEYLEAGAAAVGIGTALALGDAATRARDRGVRRAARGPALTDGGRFAGGASRDRVDGLVTGSAGLAPAGGSPAATCS